MPGTQGHKPGSAGDCSMEEAPENATHTKLKNRGRMVLVTPVAGPWSPLQWQSLSRFSVHDEVILGMGRGLGTYCFLGKLFCIGRGHK